jgi:hypothetical protein
VLGIVHEQTGKPLHGRKAEAARQQFKPPMPEKRPTGHPRCRRRNGDREAIGECGASSAFSDLVYGLVDVVQRTGR